ncbi:MAG TPA: IclR family transcriptional regulator, partial [Psychrobacter sp.]|nr:IclR family transcriptional regulator [Psychrobacter sp.]
WFKEGPVVIHSVESDTPVSIITRIGSRMPLTTSATGRLFASMHNENRIKSLANAEWLASNADTDIDHKWELYEQMLANIRSQSYATVTGDMLMGISAISLPIHEVPVATDSGQQVDLSTEYAMTVIGTTEQLPKDKMQQLVETIKRIMHRHLIDGI